MGVYGEPLVNGSKRFRNAPEIIRVKCPTCGRVAFWPKAYLVQLGVGSDVALPDLLHGLARLIECDRHKLSEFERKSKPCGLRYEGLGD